MVTQEQILDVLRGINDPEMPISIVDLGIVERICVEAADLLESAKRLEAAGKRTFDARGANVPRGATGGLPPVAARAGEPPVAPATASGAYEAALTNIRIDILPTFVGCPALPMIEREIREKVGALAGVGAVEVRFRFDPPWSVDRISPTGRAALSLHGVTVPKLVQVSTPAAKTGKLRCPFCDSDSTRMESAYGPTRCRMIYYCESCRNSFEHLKRV